MTDEATEIENVEFKIKLSSEWHDDPPIFQVLLDDETIDMGAVTERNSDKEEKVITFSRELGEGTYTLKIRLLEKKWKNTKLNEDGTILMDQLLRIDEIEIDEIELGHLAYRLSNFHKQTNFINGKKTQLPPVYEETPEQEKYTSIGYNGEYRLKFSVPTYMWFLENL
jgi:hypothetical protein